MEHIEVQKACECLECLVRETLQPVIIGTFVLLLLLVVFLLGNLIICSIENKVCDNDN